MLVLLTLIVMALFRYDPGKAPYFIEAGWHGKSYKKNPILVHLTQRNDQGEFDVVKQIGSIEYDEEALKRGVHFKVPELGDLEIRLGKILLVLTEVQVYLNGQKLKGSEIMQRYGVNIGRYT